MKQELVDAEHREQRLEQQLEGAESNAQHMAAALADELRLAECDKDQLREAVSIAAS